jgi:NAD(P)H dehydrogenase (quinone)
MEKEPYILVLYYSRAGSVKALAEAIANGVEQVRGIHAKLRTVRSSHDSIDSVSSGDPFIDMNELRDCAGLALGSPTRFGNMAGALKNVLDETGQLWMSGALIGKPASVFTSTSTLHGGQESTLLSMMTPLLHHGMVIVGIPFSEHDLTKTHTGGSPYGATHYAEDNNIKLSDEEKRLAIALGKRLAETALKLM